MLANSLLSIFRHAELVREMTLRDLKGANQGALLGWLWLVLRPLVQTAAYVLVVSFVFRARLSESSGPFDYAIYVLSGLVPYQVLTKALEEAPSLIRERMELVKQVIYPIETLPMTSLLTGSIGSLVALAIYTAVSLYTRQVTWSWLLLPLPIVLLALFALGVSWVFMIAGVVVKDLREAVSLCLGLTVFFSPVVASEAMVGPRAWRLLQWNPLTHVVVCFRDVFLGQFHPLSWTLFACMTLVAVVVGAWTISKTKLLINEYI